MLGVCLLFVGIVLINNGMCALYHVDGRSAAVMNIFTGGLSLFINFVNLMQGNYYAAGTVFHRFKKKDPVLCKSKKMETVLSARILQGTSILYS